MWFYMEHTLELMSINGIGSWISTGKPVDYNLTIKQLRKLFSSGKVQLTFHI